MQSRPWDAAITKIDNSLLDIKATFDSSFAEGQSDVKPKELIKRGVFRHIWEKLSKDVPEFKTVDQLDAYYQDVSQNFKTLVGDYLRLDRIKEWSVTHNLIGPVTEREMETIKKIIHLYHALVRCRFLMEELNNSYSDDKCEDMSHSLLVQAQVNQDLLAKIDVELFQSRSVNTLKQFNQYLVELLRGKGYGEVAVENLLSSDEGEKSGFAAFLVLNAKLNELPTTSELADLVNGKMFDSEAMRAHKIAQHITTIQTVRHLLRQVCNEIYIASCDSAEQLAADYDALLQIKDKINNSADLEAFFAKFYDMKRAVESDTQFDASIPMLRLAGRSVIAECGLNGWRIAGRHVLEDVFSIIETTRNTSTPYNESLDVYNQAIELINNQDKLFAAAARLVREWRSVNEQMHQVLLQCDQLLGVTEDRIVSLSQTKLQYVGDFFKHHWPKMVIGAVVLAAPAAAVSFTVMASAASAAVLIPAGVVAGGAGGAGVGLLKDHVSPPPKRQAINLRPNVTVAGVDSHYIINKLFDPKDAVPAKFPIKLMTETRKPAAVAPASSVLDLPAAQTPTPPLQRKEAASLVTPEATAEPAVPSNWLPTMRELAALPAQIPAQVASLPWRVAAIPGRVAALPGQALGLFSRRPQPSSETPPATKPEAGPK